MQLRILTCAFALIISAPTLNYAGSFDWPQWQGPDLTAMSAETGLLKEWPADGPPLAWKIDGLGGGYLACLDFETGDVLWNEKDPDKRRVKKGAVAFADNLIYYRTEEGEIVLIEPNKTEYIERGRFEQPDRSKSPAWTHPVLANGKLYVRDQDVLYCYNVKAAGE